MNECPACGCELVENECPACCMRETLLALIAVLPQSSLAKTAEVIAVLAREAMLFEALTACSGSRREAAKRLGMDEENVSRLLRAYPYLSKKFKVPRGGIRKKKEEKT